LALGIEFINDVKRIVSVVVLLDENADSNLIRIYSKLLGLRGVGDWVTLEAIVVLCLLAHPAPSSSSCHALAFTTLHPLRVSLTLFVTDQHFSAFRIFRSSNFPHSGKGRFGTDFESLRVVVVEFYVFVELLRGLVDEAEVTNPRVVDLVEITLMPVDGGLNKAGAALISDLLSDASLQLGKSCVEVKLGHRKVSRSLGHEPDLLVFRVIFGLEVPLSV